MRIVRSFIIGRNLSTASRNWDVDVLIAGSGVIGAALAASLSSKLGNLVRIALVDVAPPAELSKCISSQHPQMRVYALSPSTIALLKEVNAWQHIRPRSMPYYDMQVWEAEGPGLLRFSAADIPAAELGRIAEDSTIQAALLHTLQSSNVSHHIGYTIQSLDYDNEVDEASGPVTVTLTNPKNNNDTKRLTARLVVGADGGNSSVRRLSGIGTCGRSYGEEALVATVQTAAPHNTAWQRFLPSGPLALLPLWDNYSSIVWSDSPAAGRRRKSLSPEEFSAELNEALRHPPASGRWSYKGEDKRRNDILPSWLGDSPPLRFLKREAVQLLDTAVAAASQANPFQMPPEITATVSKVMSFPLQLTQASSYAARRIALVGDAAHSVHPMAGQGMNLGMSDVATLSRLLAAEVLSGGDIGAGDVLERYSRDRSRRNAVMMGGIDSLHRIFESPHIEAVELLRSMGMLTLNSTGILKKQVARFAMGVTDDYTKR